MSTQEKNYLTPEVLEFATVAVPFCALLHEAAQTQRADFVERLLKILPLLYVKSSLLPSIEQSDEAEELFALLPESVSEEEYTYVQRSIEDLLDREDLFLETLSDDMQYSDVPMTARISECLADVYQPVGNLVGILRDENFVALPTAISFTHAQFEEYWGDRLLAALRALHRVRYTQEAELAAVIPTLPTEEDFEAHIDKMFD